MSLVAEDDYSMPPAMLVSASYDRASNKALLKFYEPESEKLILWRDRTGHKPYCFSRLPPEDLDGESMGGVIGIEGEVRYDLAEDQQVHVSKIVADNPLAIGGQPGAGIRDKLTTWESDIKYYETYLYDQRLTVGRYYTIRDGRVLPHEMEISDEVRIALKSLLWDKVDSDIMVDPEEFKECILGWADLLNQPIPQIRRLSLDIEVESEQGRLPDPKAAKGAVTAVGMKGTGGFDRILVLRRSDAEEGTNELGSDVDVSFYDSEKEMLQDAFDAVRSFPFVITYNGDEFDLPYLYYRARGLGIREEDIPFYMMRTSATVREGVHLDLYRTVSNRSFQIYAFSMAYTSFSLDSVSEALLGKKKISYGINFDQMTLYQTANYCYHDALLTYELTSFNGDLLMNLLVIISRIGRMPIDDIARVGVSQWIRSLLYYEHRSRNCLIPRRDDLERRSQQVMSDAVIKNKKYRGGLVVDPRAGIHFNVVVMDFASLYPSIIKVRNLSYETVRCPHPECRKNAIPQTNHWVCSKRNGLTSMIIGSLRDLRVNYYKSLSRKETLTDAQRQQYTVVSQALKVILNASYGVMGADTFPLYFLPAAEATTAVGRHTIMESIKRCSEAGIEVLYGDTDSLFIKDPTDEQIRLVMDQAKKFHGVDLEVDKVYRYCVLSNRKKNYFGVTKSGKVDVKGLTGKKSNTPPFVKHLFGDIATILSQIRTLEEFEKAKFSISEKISEYSQRLEDRKIPVSDLAFTTVLSKAPSEYTKVIPQHIRAARQLGPVNLAKGDRISYVKTIGSMGVKPVQKASKDGSDIDIKKYTESIQSTLEPITDALDLDIDAILTKSKQTGLEDFFW